MKPIFASLFCCVIICSACNNKATSPLKPSNLESSFISIDADSSYTLKTGKGSIIKIAAETFVVDDGQKVDIEIKEAFTMEDILLAGLTTESNGRPLKSGGMIYFNATSGGKQLDINKPIGISIPSETYDPNMQLFKGEIKDDSSVNWVNPVPLDTTPVAATLLEKNASINSERISDSSLPGTTISRANMITQERDCGYDTVFISRTDSLNTISVIEEDTSKTLNVPVNNINKPLKAFDMEGLRQGFTDDGTTMGVYDFTIETMGWYNIDAYVEGYEGSTEVELTVKLNNSNNSSMNVYLFCPSRKMLSVGMPTSGNDFSFNKINDKIPLFLNDDAIIIAFGSSKTTMYYGTAAFKVAKSQQLTIDLKETTEEEIKTFVIENNIDGIKIDSYKKEFTITKRNCDDMLITDSSHAYK